MFDAEMDRLLTLGGPIRIALFYASLLIDLLRGAVFILFVYNSLFLGALGRDLSFDAEVDGLLTSAGLVCIALACAGFYPSGRLHGVV